jgi:hypothetical protein
MLAEKFFLVLEALRRNAALEGSLAATAAPHIPVKLPPRKQA